MLAGCMRETHAESTVDNTQHEADPIAWRLAALQSHVGRHVGHVAVACRAPCWAHSDVAVACGTCIDYRLEMRRKRPWCMCQVHVQCRICHGGALSTVRGAAAVRRLSHVTHVTRALRESAKLAATVIRVDCRRDDVRSLISTGLCADYSLLVPGSQRERSVWSHAVPSPERLW